jgi:hypothetical protein
MIVQLTLARGVEVDGVRHREVVLGPVSGAVTELVGEAGEALLPAERFSLLLQYCLVRLGPWQRPTLDQVRQLTVGDRDALALHLRALSFGDRIDCVIRCPSCAERMEVELAVSSLLLPPDEGEAEHVPPVGGRLRPPTGQDLEAAARTAVHDPAAAARHLLAACAEDDGGLDVDALTDEEVAELGASLAEVEPQSDLLLDLECPGCQAAFQLPFDPGGFLLQELAVEAGGLHREVHALALHYHWSERDILGLPAPKRRIYLDLLVEALPAGEA